MRTEIKVTMKSIYKYEKPGYGYYANPVEAYIYTMTGEDGRTYVWKTTSVLAEDGNIINRGDVLRIKATIKAETEYKGQPQTEVQRVVLVDRLVEAETKEQYIARRAEEQMNSLKDGDIIWDMPYRQYKSHYSDCETVKGSFRRESGESMISVIIRDGRMKASGVRGMQYYGYEFYFTNADGKEYRTCYKAVSEENAKKRLLKEYPEATEIRPGKKLYDYRMYDWC